MAEWGYINEIDETTLWYVQRMLYVLTLEYTFTVPPEKHWAEREEGLSDKDLLFCLFRSFQSIPFHSGFNYQPGQSGSLAYYNQ